MIELRNDDLSVGLVPEIGGSVAWFRRGGVDLMRPLCDRDRSHGDVLGVAMFPMVPYANRIADNAFAFEGRTYRFQPNNPPEKFNVHGTGWHSPWQGEQVADNEALLTLLHLAPSEPYSYFAAQRFRLEPDRLIVTTSIENRGAWRMPFGFGQHPWFHRDADTIVSFRADTLWIEGWDNTASEKIATPPEFSFATPRRLPPARRNNCYGHWDGRLEIAWPARRVGLRVHADPVFRHLMFYADPARPFFCIEPQTNVVSAFNMAPPGDGYDLGTIVLAPGERASGTISFAARGL